MFEGLCEPQMSFSCFFVCSPPNYLTHHHHHKLSKIQSWSCPSTFPFVLKERVRSHSGTAVIQFHSTFLLCLQLVLLVSPGSSQLSHLLLSFLGKPVCHCLQTHPLGSEKNLGSDPGFLTSLGVYRLAVTTPCLRLLIYQITEIGFGFASYSIHFEQCYCGAPFSKIIKNFKTVTAEH